jgi:multiphosphoryl transfer protein
VSARDGRLRILAPLAGWSTPLEESPDEVFARRLLGGGVAIDPTAGSLHAPCDGELVQVPATRHAVTLRTAGGCEVLVHVGIDTVGLKGEGFEVHVREGERVRAGQRLLSFDLDLLARRAKSVLTPVVVMTGSGFRILAQTLDREVAVGELLMELIADGHAAAGAEAVRASDAVSGSLVRRVRVGFAHGIHARPAALLAGSLRSLSAEVRVALRERTANARSPVALMGLGAQCGDELEVRASGPDAAGALAAFAAAAAAHEPAAAPAAPASRASNAPAGSLAPAAADSAELSGVIASRGLGVGEALQLKPTEPEVSERGAGAERERAALERARALVHARLTRDARQSAAAAAEIAAAHLALLEDPELLAAAQARIAQGSSAGFAWRSALRSGAEELRRLGDARMAERVDDLRDLESQVLLALGGADTARAPALPPRAIVIARELLPSQLAALDTARVAGIGLAAGGPTSHVAILSAALGIPTLVALGPRVLAVPDGTSVVLDAERGVFEPAPPLARLDAARAQLVARDAARAARQATAQRECRTADGTRIEVFANIGSVAEAHAAIRNGAEGCGLLRTEFLFLDRQAPPDEREQAAQYQAIADALGHRPLTIRTLDAGGDKPIAYLPQPREDNPALGLRGVRTGLAHPQLLDTQLRAILAVRPPASCRILLPMITDPEEVAEVRALLESACAELGRAQPIALGVMIETPAAAMLADRLAAVADFLSIGTNDLTQYTLAMDRGHPQLAPRLDALHPAVLRLIERTAAAARARARLTAVCGGLASEALVAPLLVGLGVEELSAVPAVIPQLKARLARVSLADCRDLAQRALAAQSAAAVRALLHAAAAGAVEDGA